MTDCKLSRCVHVRNKHCSSVSAGCKTGWCERLNLGLDRWRSSFVLNDVFVAVPMTEQQVSDDLVKSVEDRLRAHESSLERRYAGLRSQIHKQREELDRWRERFEADVATLLGTLERIEKESTSRLEQSLHLIREAQRANQEEHRS